MQQKHALDWHSGNKFWLLLKVWKKENNMYHLAVTVLKGQVPLQAFILKQAFILLQNGIFSSVKIIL